MINNVFYKPPEENPQKSNLENEGAMEWVQLFLSNNKETPCACRTAQTH
jgi:hypothetical protein